MYYSNATSRDPVRLLVGRRIVILHGFIKKSERTPLRERRTAETRMKEVKHANT